MLKLRMKPFLDIQDTLVQFSVLAHSQDPKIYPHVRPQNRIELTDLIDALLPELDAPGFDLCRKGAQRLRDTLQRSPDTVPIRGDVDDLRRRLLDQMETTFCLLLSQQDKEFYEPAAPPFGIDVEANLSSANEDIYEASKCLALERSTACVMHLMRVCEVGLKALANTINVPSQGDWGGYLRAIEDELSSRAKKAGARSSDEQFYSEAAIAFGHLKRAWRNPSMHVDKTYSPARAKEIFEAVKSFISFLATKISE
jgi:hypothetical protein